MIENIRIAPEVDRADAGLTEVTLWGSPEPGQQRRLADAAVEAWREVPSPPGLLSCACLLGTDGREVLHYVQWAGEDRSRADRARWGQAVGAATPEAECHGATSYRLYRSRYDSTETPGCVVLVTRRFDGPDPSRAREWADAIFAVPGGEQTWTGLIAAHFHIATDGSSVLNYAEWTSEDAHRAMMDGAPARIENNPAMCQVESWPGLTSTTMKRYLPYRMCTAS